MQIISMKKQLNIPLTNNLSNNFKRLQMMRKFSSL